MIIEYTDYSHRDYNDLVEHVGVKPKHIPMIIANFLQESASITEILHVAIEAQEYDSIKANAHALKGSASNLHFDAIAKSAYEIEVAATRKNASFPYEDHYQAIKKSLETISL